MMHSLIIVGWLLSQGYCFSLNRRGYVLNHGRLFSQPDRALMRIRFRDDGFGKWSRWLRDIVIMEAASRYQRETGLPAPRRIHWA